MQLQLNLKDENIQSIVSSINSLVGQRSLYLNINVIPKGAETNKEYIKKNLSYLIIEALKQAENNKEEKRYRSQIDLIPGPNPFIPPSDFLEIV